MRRGLKLTILLAGIALGTGAAWCVAQMAIDATKPLPMAFVTLGTNSGPIPDPRRAEPANLLQIGDRNILVDVGDGAAWQAAKAGVSLRQIDTIFISHLHFDHSGGLFALLGQRFQMLESGTLSIYGPPGTKALVDALVRGIVASSPGPNGLRDVFTGKAGANLRVVELAGGQRVVLGRATATAVLNTHYSASPHSDGPASSSFAFRFDLPGQSIVYTGDTGPSRAVERLARDADLLVCEIMIPEIELDKVTADAGLVAKLPFVRGAIRTHFEREHMSPREVGLLAARARVKALVLTHIAIPDDHIEDARRTIAALYKGPIRFAADLDRFVIPAKTR